MATRTRARPVRLLLGLLHTAGWMVVLPLLAVAATRVFSWDSRASFVVVNSLTPFLYLPAWPVATVAGLTRRWPLAAVAGLVVVAHAAFALPELREAEDLPAAARTAPSFRVFSGNVYARNTDFRRYALEIKAATADVVLLQEATPAFVRSLDDHGALTGLPYRISVPRSDPFGALIASRYPLADTGVTSVRGRPIALTATIEVGGTAVRVIGVHAVSPVGRGREEWIADLHHIAAMAKAERMPLLLAGDFNATWGHRAFRHVMRQGLTDAAAARGHPYRMTWPRDEERVPAFVRIDHVLTKGRLAVTRISVGEGAGSDHRPLIAEVAVLPAG